MSRGPYRSTFRLELVISRDFFGKWPNGNSDQGSNADLSRFYVLWFVLLWLSGTLGASNRKISLVNSSATFCSKTAEFLWVKSMGTDCHVFVMRFFHRMNAPVQDYDHDPHSKWSDWLLNSVSHLANWIASVRASIRSSCVVICEYWFVRNVVRAERGSPEQLNLSIVGQSWSLDKVFAKSSWTPCPHMGGMGGEPPPHIFVSKIRSPPYGGGNYPKFPGKSRFFVWNLPKSVQKRQFFGGACGGLKNRRFSSVLRSKSGFFGSPPGKNPPPSWNKNENTVVKGAFC